jgi:uncharacterized protein (TIGR02266 family)
LSGPVTIELSYRSPGAFLVAYATNLVKGGLFVENAAPLAVGTPLVLRLSAPTATAIDVEAVVTWTRGAGGPALPAGMGVAIAPIPDALGEAVDRMAFGFAGIHVLLATSEAAPRAILTRYLKSILACEIIDVDFRGDGTAKLEGLDLAVIDLDSSGPPGFELLARLRAHARAGSAPALALAQIERDRMRALQAGFDAALANPPVFADLQAAALRCLGRPTARVARLTPDAPPAS